MSIVTAGWVLAATPIALMLLSYVGYPAFVALLAASRRERSVESGDLPELTISVPVYNEAAAIGGTIENLLAVDYPAERRHIVVVSDASTDATDEIVRSFADRGVVLVRLERRSGKTAAENEAGRHLRGTIVVNLDATIHIPPGAIKALVRAFDDPTVGVASGRDVSTGARELEQNTDESNYVGYEMWVRKLETRAGSIVGASGCFYAIRRQLFDAIFPEALSRDFASPLIAREHGFRSVSVQDAICYVPRTKSLKAEYRRKVRTMTRGLETLWFKRHLLNPVRYGRFALFLLGHKLVRWLVFLTIPLAAIGLLLLAGTTTIGKFLVLGGVLGALAGALGYYWPGARKPPRILAVAGFILSSHLAGVVAWYQALRGELNPVWEPTRRS